MPLNITFDSLVSGALGAVIGSMLTIGYDRGERRRLERLPIAERLHPLLSQDAEHPSPRGHRAEDRDLAALVAVQPLYRRRRVHQLVRQYQEARAQRCEVDELGQSRYTAPAEVAAAAKALLPFTEHR